MRFITVFAVIASVTGIVSSASITSSASIADQNNQKQVSYILQNTDPRNLIQGLAEMTVYVKSLDQAQKQKESTEKLNQITETYYVKGVCKYVSLKASAPKKTTNFMLSTGDSTLLRNDLKYFTTIKYSMQDIFIPLNAEFMSQYAKTSPTLAVMYSVYSSNEFVALVKKHENPSADTKNPLSAIVKDMSLDNLYISFPRISDGDDEPSLEKPGSD